MLAAMGSGGSGGGPPGDPYKGPPHHVGALNTTADLDEEDDDPDEEKRNKKMYPEAQLDLRRPLYSDACTYVFIDAHTYINTSTLQRASMGLRTHGARHEVVQ